MYTRNYRISKEDNLPVTHVLSTAGASETPPTLKNAVSPSEGAAAFEESLETKTVCLADDEQSGGDGCSCERAEEKTSHETSPAVEKKRFRAVRVPHIRDDRTVAPVTCEKELSDSGCATENAPVKQEIARKGCETALAKRETDSCGSATGECLPADTGEAHVRKELQAERNCRQSEKWGLLRGFSSDEMLVLALAVLIICEGGDDILILALCFILA